MSDLTDEFETSSAPGPGRPPLRVSRIVEAAIALIDDEGAAALTLRALASRLGSSTATLYRHFDGRTALIDAVIDAVFGEVELADVQPPDATWTVGLTATATSLFETLARHPNLAPLILERIRTSPNVLRLREHTLVLLRSSGFSPRDAVKVYATIGRYVLGFGVQSRIDARSRTVSDSGLPIPADRYPVSAASTTIGPIPLAEEFHFGLSMMLAGMQIRRTSRRTS